MRRARGSGSLHQLDSGRWRLRVYRGRDPVTGRHRFASRNIEARNVTEARKQLAAWVVELDADPLGTSATVAMLMREWLRHIEVNGRAPRTITEARRTIDRVIVPAIGAVPLPELTARHIDLMLQSVEHLSPATRRRYFSVLAAALRQAVKWGWIDSSPAGRATAPAASRAGVVVPDRAEVGKLIEAMPGEPWQMALRLAVLTGARRGELCALRWDDVTPELIRIRHSAFRLNGQTVVKAPKNGRERAVVMAPAVAAIMAAWRQSALQRALEVGLDLAGDAFVLSTWPDSSRPLNPDTLSAHVRRAAVTAGLEHLHLHSLRHFAATEMLSAGVDVRQVADTLGHVDGGRLALQVYGHPTSERQRLAAAAMAASLPMPALDAKKPPA